MKCFGKLQNLRKNFQKLVEDAIDGSVSAILVYLVGQTKGRENGIALLYLYEYLNS